ncbi:MAG: hypothetical protein IJY28_05625 [Clostridia bacterium]|nr:hypothetical protein [Clostridia bacterium]
MKEKKYSQDIAHAINTFLKEDGWKYSFNEQNGQFQFSLVLKSKLKKIHYRIDVSDDDYTVYGVSPIGVDANDAAMMATMAEFVCRANYGLQNGNFELDVRDGEIRFKSYVDCDGQIPAQAVIQNSIYCPAEMFKVYGEGVVGIIFGDMTAKEAVEKCEKTPIQEACALLGGDIDADTADIDTIIERLEEKLRSCLDELDASEA